MNVLLMCYKYTNLLKVPLGGWRAGVVCRRCENFDLANTLGSEGKLYKTQELSMFMLRSVTDPLLAVFLVCIKEKKA